MVSISSFKFLTFLNKVKLNIFGKTKKYYIKVKLSEFGNCIMITQNNLLGKIQWSIKGKIAWYMWPN